MDLSSITPNGRELCRLPSRPKSIVYGLRGRKFEKRLFCFFPEKAEAHSAYQEAGNDQDSLPADPTSPANEQRCKSAPSGDKTIAELDAAARRANDRLDKWEKYLTAAHWRLGTILLALRKHFLNGWEAHLEELGIEETRWKRAKCLATFFETEAECRNLPLETALSLAGWGKKQTQVKKHAGKNRQQQNIAAISKGEPSAPEETDGCDDQHHGGAAATTPSQVNGNNQDEQAHEEVTTEVEVRPDAIQAAATFLAIAGGDNAAAWALVVQAAKGGEESVANILLGIVEAARSILGWQKINDVLIAIKHTMTTNGVGKAIDLTNG